MPAKNPRLTTVLEKPLYKWIKENARERGVSLSLHLRDIVLEAYEREEDAYWVKEGEERLKSFDRRRALTHDEVWGKHK